MIKAILVDLHGTLLPYGETEIPMSAINALTLLRMQGIKLFLSTSHHPKTLDPYRKIFEFDAYLALDGQYAWAGQKILFAHPLSKEYVTYVLDYLDKNPFPCIFTEIHATYTNRITEKTELYAKIHNSTPPAVLPNLRNRSSPLFQMTALLSKEEERALHPLFEPVTTKRWSPLFTQIQPKNKDNTLAFQSISKYFSIHPHEIIGFADSDNDMDLLHWVGSSVAMKNGSPRLGKIADYITDSAENNGIYNALVHYNMLES